MGSQETKACPYCAEKILAAARKCKHCGKMLDGAAPSALSSATEASQPRRATSAEYDGHAFEASFHQLCKLLGSTDTAISRAKGKPDDEITNEYGTRFLFYARESALFTISADSHTAIYLACPCLNANGSRPDSFDDALEIAGVKVGDSRTQVLAAWGHATHEAIRAWVYAYRTGKTATGSSYEIGLSFSGDQLPVCGFEGRLKGEEKEELNPAQRCDKPFEIDEYLKKMSNSPLLTIDQEQELGKDISLGVQEARTQIIESNRRLVVAISMKYKNKGLQFSDIVEKGHLGLLLAIDKFRHERGFRFSVYAYWWIKRSIERAIANQTKDIHFPPVHFFNGEVDSNNVSAEKIIGLATLMTNAAVKFASYCLVEMYSGKPISEADLDAMHNVQLETFWLYFHVIDRDSIFALHSVTKKPFMNKLIAEVFLLYKSRFEKLPMSKNTDDFIDLCNKRQNEYRTIIPDDGNIRGTLFWEYGKKIASIMSRPNDDIIITESYANAIASINAMQLSKVFDNL